MDFGIKITCKECGCSFSLRSRRFKERVSLECPCCGQQVPSEIYANIKTGLDALGRVPASYPNEGRIEKELFAFEITPPVTLDETGYEAVDC